MNALADELFSALSAPLVALNPDKASRLCDAHANDLRVAGIVTRADILATVEKIEKELTPAD